MKATSTRTAVSAVIAALFLAVMLGFVAQTAGLPGPNGGPKATNWYSLQKLQAGVKAPPLPSKPFPELPVYPLDDGSFAYDDREVDYEKLRSEAASVPASATQSFDRGAALTALEECASELLVFRGSNTLTLIVTNAAAGRVFDLFRTFELSRDSITNSFWHWVAQATNGQSLVFSDCPCDWVFYVLGCTNDTDGDGLTDAYEELVSKTSPATNHSVNGLYTDKEMENVPVNSPEEDCGNEQNTQFESTCAVLGSNVIVAYVDSNRGVYNLGTDSRLPNRKPEFVGYAVSTNGGLSFADMGVLPLSIQSTNTTDDDGTVGDPVLAVDQVSNIVYLACTSPRKAGNNGIPLWESSNCGVTFGQPIMVRDDILGSDKPWIAVDNWDGTGQHDVYLVCTGGVLGTNRIWLTVSSDGGVTWNAPLVLAESRVTNVTQLNSPIIQVAPDHLAYVFWFEQSGDGLNFTNWIKLRSVTNRTDLGPVRVVAAQRLPSPDSNLRLRRSNSADASDWFNAWPFPVVAVDPRYAAHLYVTYADRGTNSGDRADIYFVRSTDRGSTWSSPMRVNTVWTNDQWMPVLAVKPDGTQLFVGWYDRRNDTNNSLIDVYGCWGTIGTNGVVTFDAEFRISTVSFPPVFAGTRGEFESIYKQPGYYDPVYPPENVNLHWHYPEWPEPPPPGYPDDNLTGPQHIGHVGEYNGASFDGQSVNMSWTDNRQEAPGSLHRREQSDVRIIRLGWPQ